MKYTAVIWDFNGTIADDIDLGIGAVNKMLAERGLPILSTREEYRAKLRFPIRITTPTSDSISRRSLTKSLRTNGLRFTMREKRMSARAQARPRRSAAFRKAVLSR